MPETSLFAKSMWTQMPTAVPPDPTKFRLLMEKPAPCARSMPDFVPLLIVARPEPYVLNVTGLLDVPASFDGT
jgi:hypothetical protein